LDVLWMGNKEGKHQDCAHGRKNSSRAMHWQPRDSQLGAKLALRSSNSLNVGLP
jgi:hypothetical protein